jgi:hypothetical protein
VANKRLYTESDVAALPRGALLTLGKDALATPAALDMAFVRGVRVSYADGKSVEAKSPAQAEVLAKMLAQEGTYIVSVKSNAGVVTRLEAGVPVPFGTFS